MMPVSVTNEAELAYVIEDLQEMLARNSSSVRTIRADTEACANTESVLVFPGSPVRVARTRWILRKKLRNRRPDA